MPRGATTSAAFFPHLRAAHPQRERLERRRSAHQARQCFGFDVARGAARAAHADQELPEAVIELLDVGEHPHPQMVRRAEPTRPCSVGERSELYMGKRTALAPFKRSA